MILMVQFATAQDSLQQSATGGLAPHLTNPTHPEIFRFGSSIAGERIASTTCDPFMTQAQEQRLMRMLFEQDDAPWSDFNLTRLRDRLSNECTVWIDEKSIENEGVTMDQPLMKEVPIGVLGARLATLLGSNQLAFTIQRNRLEITSQSDCSSGIRRIYDVLPLVRTVSMGTNNQETVLAYPLVELIEATISPDCWQSGGGNSMIREFIPPGSTDRVCLIVLCNTENHIAIQNLLDQLNTFGFAPQAPRVPTKKTLPPTQAKRLPFDRMDASAF